MINEIIIKNHKKCFVFHEHILNISFISQRIIASCSPVENSPEIMKQFFEEKFGNKILVMSLCIEDIKTFNENLFGKEIKYVLFPMINHESPSLEMMDKAVEMIDDFLSQNNYNSVCVHCHGGVGRTGLVICGYFLKKEVFKTSQEAINYFNEKRCDNFKCIKNPAQKLYLKYYENYLKLKKDNLIENISDLTYELIITSIEVKWFIQEYNYLYCLIKQNNKKIFISEIKNLSGVNIFENKLTVNGDIKVYFFKDTLTREQIENFDNADLYDRCELLVTFNTYFEKEKKDLLYPSKKVIDKIYKKANKIYDNIQIVIHFKP